LANINCKANQ